MFRLPGRLLTVELGHIRKPHFGDLEPVLLVTRTPAIAGVRGTSGDCLRW